MILSQQLLTNRVIAKLLFDERQRGAVSEDEATIYAHLLVCYGIIEEAFLLYVKNWIDEDMWLQWSAWLVALSAHPQFKLLPERTAGTFDKRFEEYVAKILRESEVKTVVAK